MKSSTSTNNPAIEFEVEGDSSLEFLCHRKWTLSDFESAMDLHKRNTQKQSYYGERTAFARWVRKDTNYKEVWAASFKTRDPVISLSLAKSLLHEFEYFCEQNSCFQYFRHAENFYRKNRHFIFHYYGYDKEEEFI